MLRIRSGRVFTGDGGVWPRGGRPLGPLSLGAAAVAPQATHLPGAGGRGIAFGGLPPGTGTECGRAPG